MRSGDVPVHVSVGMKLGNTNNSMHDELCMIYDERMCSVHVSVGMYVRACTWAIPTTVCMTNNA